MNHSDMPFTRFELLVVIVTGVLLAVMLFCQLRLVIVCTTKGKTTSALSKLQAELVNFKQLNGRYPGENRASPAWDVWFAPAKPFSAVLPEQWEQINAQLVGELRTAGAPIEGMTVVDAWKQVLHYRPARYYPRLANNEAPIDGLIPPNQDSYQLWSTGADQTDQGGIRGSDDLTCWEK